MKISNITKAKRLADEIDCVFWSDTIIMQASWSKDIKKKIRLDSEKTPEKIKKICREFKKELREILTEEIEKLGIEIDKNHFDEDESDE